MRRLVTGVDDAGRSCVVEDAELALAGMSAPSGSPGVSAAQVFAVLACPAPVRPAGRATFHDMGVPPGLARWTVFRFAPEYTSPMHHTDTIDVDIVLEGSVEIVLDDRAHPLEQGDCVVVTGVDHGWKAGPEGVLMSVAVIGTPPRT